MESQANALLATLGTSLTVAAGGPASGQQATDLKPEESFFAALRQVLGEPFFGMSPDFPATTPPGSALDPETQASTEVATIAMVSLPVRQEIAGSTGAVSRGKKPDGPNLPSPVLADTTQEKFDDVAQLTTRTGALPQAVDALVGTNADTGVRDLMNQPLTASAAVFSSSSQGDHSAVRLSAPPIQQAPGHPGWDNALGERIVWMTGQSVREASIQLNPPELGHLQVKVSVDGDQASVSFVSQHATVRDAIDGAIPRLREMLGSDGLNLADVSVGDQRQAHADHNAGGHGRYGAGRDDAQYRPDDFAGPDISVSETLGLVDFYA